MLDGQQLLSCNFIFKGNVILAALRLLDCSNGWYLYLVHEHASEKFPVTKIHLANEPPFN